MSARMKLAGLITALVLAAGSALAQTPNIAGPMVPNGQSSLPGGSSLTLQYNNAGSFGGMSGTSWDDTNRSLTLTGATVTTSNPVLNLSQTWNAGGVTFTGLKFNATSTASATGSMLIDLQLAGSTLFNVDTTGKIRGLASASGYLYQNDVATWTYGRSGSNYISLKDVGLQLRSSVQFGWTGTADSNNSLDTILTRDAANTLALRNGTSAQTFRVYGTFTDVSNGDWLSITKAAGGQATISNVANGTGTAGALSLSGGTNLLLGANNGTQWFITTSGGHFFANGDNSFDIGASGANRPRNVYVAGFVNSGSYVKSASTTVAGLTAAATAGAGARAFVTDATACTFNTTVTGGGSTACPVTSDGTTWKGG